MIVLDGDRDDDQLTRARRNVPGLLTVPLSLDRSSGSWTRWPHERVVLDERAHAGDEHLDATYVSGYDRKAGYDPAEDVESLRRHGLGPGSTVVDLGPGTGTFACAVAPLCGRVVAVDVSPVMVAALHERVAGLGLANVAVVHGRLSSPTSTTASRPTSCSPATRSTSSPTSGRRSRSTASPGSCAPRECCGSGTWPTTSSRARWASASRRGSRRRGRSTRGYTAADLAQHVRSEFSTWSWLLDILLDRTGFDVVERSYRRGAYAAYTCVRRVGPGA
jgi:hypothetical protein